MKNNLFTSLGVSMIIILFYLIFFTGTNISYGSDDYTSKIAQCKEANKKGEARSIEDFLCPETPDTHAQVYQIVLDGEFGKLDEEVEEYLNQLQAQKGKYYSGNLTYLDGYDEITQKFGVNNEYWEKYNRLCDVSETDSIVQISLSYMKQSSSALTSTFFKGSTCTELIVTKLAIYHDVATDILYLNKVQVSSDSKKKYTGKEKSTYSKLLDTFMYNIGIIQKISKKWTTKNKRDGSRG